MPIYHFVTRDGLLRETWSAMSGPPGQPDLRMFGRLHYTAARTSLAALPPRRDHLPGVDVGAVVLPPLAIQHDPDRSGREDGHRDQDRQEG
jgi:hypothetical protein